MTELPDAELREKPLLIVVDDDPLITDSLGYSMQSAFDVVASHSRSHCVQLLQTLPRRPALALVDLGLPPLPHRPDEGFALITELLQQVAGIRIVVLSGQSEAGNARHARTLGAIDFVAKPCSPSELHKVLQRALRYQTTPENISDEVLIGSSPAIQKLRVQVRQCADSAFPVLIEGESGSGKEIVAHACLHRETGRREKPFLALNCAAISPSLVEPTLFGHARGAFTGAVGAKPGYFEDAADGTLFLDEIGELPLELQAKLLRVLENGEYQRVGETQRRQSRARIIAASNRDLRSAIRAGAFRADLYHRLSVFTISVPPLREMEDDRLRLLEHFCQRYAPEIAMRFRLSEGALSLWSRYVFPGNVRELRNIVIRLCAKYPGQLVDHQALEAELDLQDEPSSPAAANSLPVNPAPTNALLQSATARLQQPEAFSLDTLLADTERTHIEAALQLANGNVSQAARLLGINRTTLYNRMEAMGRAV